MGNEFAPASLASTAVGFGVGVGSGVGTGVAASEGATEAEGAGTPASGVDGAAADRPGTAGPGATVGADAGWHAETPTAVTTATKAILARTV